ncbi:aromatic ring-hydroxylating dioxygenase subunit alpha [Cyanobium sp. Morenito 9A2]|uniref:aromatic ring-hydroxylating oxygenase subunit alpha n=1 Tax=Cyanobium sp. Morenito 9A2 TaxID=2823718 RepID=UPI0020CCD7E4|nr:aromatic ring-hydroxylating dioxygenase subunit alpha [Cyanobium sp. Morenito 9A2]MCP9850852.1 aromatic ring-hydroxylating dioxygenase subunit alpha [Cyanobium sp. Morenito 9A2]
MPLEPDRLRPFWYPVLPLDQLGEAPVAVELLGEALVIWRGADGAPHAAPDRCPHRSARLSGGSLSSEGNLQCPYHGWEFAADGACRAIPQQPERPIPEACRLHTYQAQARYGRVWVCLADQPQLPLPSFPEEHDPAQRRIDGFWERWHCSPFRVIENGLDNFHHYFVHRGLLEATTARPDPIEGPIEDTADGFRFRIPLQVHNNTVLQDTLASDAGTLTVERQVSWIAPLGLSLELEWPNGLRQRIVLHAVPTGGEATQISRFYFRNDSEEQVPAAAMVRFERGLIDQDRAILTAMATALEPWPSGEHLIEADQPIALMRQRLRELLQPR